MNEVTISESGMSFGPFPADRVWQVEKSALYKRIQEGVQIAEFIVLPESMRKDSTAWVIEAKSSSPQPETKPNFNEFIEEIRVKLSNAFMLAVATRLERFNGELMNLPTAFQNFDPTTTNFAFILVINGHQEAWLVPIQDALAKAMKGLIKTWNLPAASIAVLNSEGAIRKGLIKN